MINVDKKELRKIVRQYLNRMSNQLYYQSSFNIKKQLLKEPSIIEGDTIAITISNKPEVDTKEIIESLWSNNKKVVVPKCNPKERSMDFYAIQHFQQLESVYMDLLEPIPEVTEHVAAEEIDCIIVPGIVFDCYGYRIGYGGGYYDRYLEQFKGPLISLAFDIQIVESIPYEPHDLPIDLIITESKRIDCANNRKEV
ncbi:5-formyltetrahydrofolate cyclo-ligase [Lysinibacillus telephonicus]|uniref:5-formyltetrahydrofolate cyclo-ligase n=1 Tax=Lysinibacillus telephonicus TaxID=1714840 RepID=UPI00319EAA6D